MSFCGCTGFNCTSRCGGWSGFRGRFFDDYHAGDDAGLPLGVLPRERTDREFFAFTAELLEPFSKLDSFLVVPEESTFAHDRHEAATRLQ